MASPSERHLRPAPTRAADAAAPSVRPGQVWNDNGVRGEGGPVQVICVDSAFAYCRRGRAGDGAPRRIPLTRFDGRRRGGFLLISDADGATNLMQRRVLTALWQLDYSGLPRRLGTIADLLGGLYPPAEIRAALIAAEADGLAVRAPGDEEQWALTGGGRRLAAVG